MGFIGSHLVEALVADGARVTALSLYNSFDSQWLARRPDGGDAGVGHADPRRCTRRGIHASDCGWAGGRLSPGSVDRDPAFLCCTPVPMSKPMSWDAQCAWKRHVKIVSRRVVHTSTSEVYGSALTLPISEQHPLQGQSPYSASKIGADNDGRIVCTIFRSAGGNPASVQYIRATSERTRHHPNINSAIP